MTTLRKLITKRSAVALGIGSVALLGVTLPAGAAALVPQQSSITVETGVTEVTGSTQSSNVNLLGAAGVSLAFGVGTITIAHRRRWKIAAN